MKIIIHMLATLTIIGILSGGLLSQLNGWAAPKIKKHKEAETAAAILVVQPDKVSQQKIENIPFEAYKVFDKENQFIGYAMVYEGNGFQGKIRLMAGVNKDVSKITGIKVLEHSETPGLGDKITGEWFTGEFSNLTCAPQIDWVKGTPPSKENEIQTITAATISSKSVVAILNNGLEELRKVSEEGGK